MADRKGDPSKQPPECYGDGVNVCPHLKEVSSPTDFEGETYGCEVCGERYRLYYEDMA